MADGHIWMVQDLKFGDKCKNNSYSSSSSDKTTGVSSLSSSTYYGNCTVATNTSTPANRGYLYDWAAAMNKTGAYYGGSYQGCRGTGSSANVCQGICPEGWHVPTCGNDGEYQALHIAMVNNDGCSNDGCWNTSSHWEGVLGGQCDPNGSLSVQGSTGNYWGSLEIDSIGAYCLRFQSGSVATTQYLYSYRYYGYPVRCVRNY
jgi:uncharacterized protein (TIGR02145 family)